jgi:hypothetical protein
MELTGSAPWRIREHLRAVSARSYRRQPARWRTDDEAYVLGHEQLQAAAVAALGGRLDGYRKQLHRWADGYRDRGWPDDTPEYLLHGYFAMTSAVGDLPRMVACATDWYRPIPASIQRSCSTMSRVKDSGQCLGGFLVRQRFEVGGR